MPLPCWCCRQPNPAHQACALTFANKAAAPAGQCKQQPGRCRKLWIRASAPPGGRLRLRRTRCPFKCCLRSACAVDSVLHHGAFAVTAGVTAPCYQLRKMLLWLRTCFAYQAAAYRLLCLRARPDSSDCPPTKQKPGAVAGSGADGGAGLRSPARCRLARAVEACAPARLHHGGAGAGAAAAGAAAGTGAGRAVDLPAWRRAFG